MLFKLGWLTKCRGRNYQSNRKAGCEREFEYQWQSENSWKCRAEWTSSINRWIRATGLGKLSEESYSQRTSNEYVTVRKYGDGGINMYNPNVCQRGTHFTFNSVSFLNIGLIYGGLAGNFYLLEGTGGAGGNTPNGQWGYDGGFGMVVISW